MMLSKVALILSFSASLITSERMRFNVGKFIHGVYVDSDNRVLGHHFPLLRVYDDRSFTYSWPKGFARRWFDRQRDGVPHPDFGENFLMFPGRDYTRQPVSKKEKQMRRKDIASFRCQMYPLVLIRKEAK